MWIAAGLGVAALAMSPALPERRLAATEAAHPLRLVGHPVLGPIALAAFLHGLTLSTYDNLFPLRIEEARMSPRVAGSALALGVGAEVALMASSRALIGRFGAPALFLAGLAVSAPRWWLTGVLTDPTSLVAVQALHGLTFGAFWVGGVELSSEHAPEGLETSAQALFLAACFGGGYLVAMLVASVALDHVDIATLFQLQSGVSLLAAAVGAEVVRRTRTR